MQILRDLLAIPANIKRIAEAIEALTRRYAPPAPRDTRSTPRTYQSDK
jgi:hypothetical protein